MHAMWNWLITYEKGKILVPYFLLTFSTNRKKMILVMILLTNKHYMYRLSTGKGSFISPSNEEGRNISSSFFP